MKASKLRGLSRKYSYDKIIEMYMTCKIYLTDKQLEKICAACSHHGGCNTRGDK